MAVKIFKPSLRKKINLPFYKGYIIIKPINLFMRRCLEFIGFKTWQGEKMIIKLFGKQITINNKKWKQDLTAWSLLYRTEIVIAIASFILGAIIF